MKSVIIVGFDGLQPNQVTPKQMPNLSEMATDGVFFSEHHSVFPTMTRVNLASIHTGCYPGMHGLAANNIVVRELDPIRSITLRREDLEMVEKRTGQILLVPTLGEILAANGHELFAVSIGGKGSTFIQNPHAERIGGASIHFTFSMPGALHDEIVSRFGPWPVGPDIDKWRVYMPLSALMGRAVDVLTQYVIQEKEPTVSVLWCNQPDASQHETGVGSPQSEAALLQADEQFGRLLEWLDATNRTAETDVIVLSDHGYSTVTSTVNIETIVREAGFPEASRPGGVTVVPNGGAVLFYVHLRDPTTADRLAEWLMKQPWCGSIVGAAVLGPISGVLPAALVGAEGPRTPDLAMSLTSQTNPVPEDYAGRITSTNPWVGDHGSMSKQEVNNVLAAKGPSFKQGTRIDSPTGNVDIAPTVLSILGLPGGEQMEGRVLDEALVQGTPRDLKRATTIHKAERKIMSRVYRQEISVSTVGTTSYADYGRASSRD